MRPFYRLHGEVTRASRALKFCRWVAFITADLQHRAPEIQRTLDLLASRLRPAGRQDRFRIEDARRIRDDAGSPGSSAASSARTSPCTSSNFRLDGSSKLLPPNRIEVQPQIGFQDNAQSRHNHHWHHPGHHPKQHSHHLPNTITIIINHRHNRHHVHVCAYCTYMCMYMSMYRVTISIYITHICVST